jgi:hypothetical protein
MIHESSITLQTTRVGQLRVDPLQIRGDREASRPTLIVQLGVELFKGERDIFLDRLDAALWTRPATGTRRRIGLPATLSGFDSRHGLLNSQPQGFGPVQTQLRIELLPEDVRLLDEHVQSSVGPVARTGPTNAKGPSPNRGQEPLVIGSISDIMVELVGLEPTTS